MVWLLLLLKGIFFIFRIGDLACMTQTKDYIKGSFAVAAIIAVPTLFYDARINQPSFVIFLEFLASVLIIFAFFWVIGFAIYKIFNLENYSKTRHFDHTGWARIIPIPFILFWAFFTYAGSNSGKPDYVIPFVILAFIGLFFRAPVLAFNVIVQSYFLGLLCNVTVDSVSPSSVDASGLDLDNGLDSGDASFPDTDADVSASANQLENVDEHFRKGTWVDSYTKADGTFVEGHYRDGGMVSEHLRRK